MDITIRADEIEPRPCAAGVELLEGVVLTGTVREILDALHAVEDRLTPSIVESDRVLAHRAFGMPVSRWW